MVVTDSSARLPAAERERLRIAQVPLHILLDGADLRDGIDAIPDDIHDRGQVTTAGATRAELADAYRTAVSASGGDGVVAVHISSALSSTWSAALQTAQALRPQVRVVDSRSAAMGTGFVALAAARAAAAGAGLDAGLDAVEAAALSAVGRGHAFMVAHRLENLRRSGRIGAATSWLGTALSLKPVLRIDDDGRLVLAQRVRTVTKAHAAMVEQVVDIVAERPAVIVVHHVDNPDGAAEIAAELASRLPHAAPPTISAIGPLLAVHVGGGAVAVCLQVEGQV